jgi:hypothetical protein
METKEAYVIGTLRDQSGAPFHGRVIFERRPDSVYYTWRMETNEGQWLCTVSRNVSFHVIPMDQNVFDFALLHAIEGLKKYRINRKYLFNIVRWEWSPA